MIHLYAFTFPGAGLPAVSGIGGAELDSCRIADVAAVVSEVGDDDPGGEREAVLAHGLVVEALRDATDAVVPVRFGERFAGRDELAAAVGDRVADLRERLAEVRGCVEFGVRMLAETRGATTPRAVGGAAYMHERLASVAQADAVAAELHRPLARCARASVVTPGAGHAAAYLVRDDERPDFERALAGFVAAHPEVTVVCTGPWAPYSFAEGA